MQRRMEYVQRHFSLSISKRTCSGFVACALLLFATTAFAQSEQSYPSGAMIIRPVKVELAIAAGEEKTSTITLSNGTGGPLAVTVSFEDIAPAKQSSGSEDPFMLLGDANGANPLREMLSVPKRSFELLSGKEVSVPVSVRVPKDIEPGGRYGSVVFTFHPALSFGEGGAANVAVEGRIAATFFVKIGESVREEGKLVAFGLFNDVKTVNKPDADHPLQFQIAYENTGNVHVNPYGRLTFSRPLGGPHEVIIDPWVVLPNATRMLEIDVRTPLAPGYYRAHLELNRGYKDIIDERTVSFWVMPTFEEALVGLLIIFIVAWLIRRSLRISKHFHR